MITNEINYEEVFKLFVHPQTDWPTVFQQPFKQGNIYCATDARSLIFLPIEKADLPFKEQKRPNATAIIPQDVIFNDEINLPELYDKLIPEMIDEEIIKESEKECKECDENGEVQFKYLGNLRTHYMYAGCPVCNGSGIIEKEITEKTGRKIPNPNKKYKMFGVAFSYEQLSRLLTACKMMGLDKITRTYGTERTGNLFKCGDASILIQPMVIIDVPESEFTIICTS